MNEHLFIARLSLSLGRLPILEKKKHTHTHQECEQARRRRENHHDHLKSPSGCERNPSSVQHVVVAHQ